MEKRFRTVVAGLAAGLFLNVAFSVMNYFLRIKNLCETLSSSPVGASCPDSAVSYIFSSLNPLSGAVFWGFILFGVLGAYAYFYRFELSLGNS